MLKNQQQPTEMQFVSQIARTGKRWSINIPKNRRAEIEDILNKPLIVTIKEIIVE